MGDPNQAPNIPFPPLELSLACRAGLPLPLPCWPLAPTPNRRVTQPQGHSTDHTGPQAPHRTRTGHDSPPPAPLFSFAASRSRGVVWAPLRNCPGESWAARSRARERIFCGHTGCLRLRCEALAWHTAHKLEGSSWRLGIF